ncbi:methionyl-tRNA formyltransferase [Paracoccus isoporae]|uniref:Methionyl-tRNA formyltransferase n=1 Tax=Paracoccus isoporae TaxID=591205 RepID=A0A1G7CHD0_9RHOB|nr:methionyl-tRNA formyltransferase [Paracoccus isoporae]SDE38709.1 methionyl-tRNA formyltransferase [Paracoccus isoporae]
MRVVFMGTPDFSVPALQAIAAAHDVVAVYCQPPRQAGRGQKPRPTPVQTAAEALRIEVRHPVSLRSDAEQAAFAALNADVAVVVAYGLILPQPILDAPRLGCLNIHASLLPRWRGAAPIHRAILEGDTQTGIAIMQMKAGLDTGPVLAERRTAITPHDTTGDLHDRLAAMGATLIAEVLTKLPLPATPQRLDGVTYASKIDKAEARIDWTQDAAQVDRKIRGLSPFPGAWCEIGWERVKLLRSALADGSGAPGEVLEEFTIACGSGAVRVLEAQRAGKRPMLAEDILRGMTLPPRLD